MKNIFSILLTSMLFAGCGSTKDEPDAWGNFEAEEVIVSAETNGRILNFDVREGQNIEKGEVIAVIDTTLLHLQKQEIDAAMKGISTRINSINAQNEVLRQQIGNININLERTANMLKDGAATQKQYDDLSGQKAVIEKQIEAGNTQRSSVESELLVYRAKKATLNEQIARSIVKCPVDGTVIEKYAETGELTAAGKPLIKTADLKLIKLKAYVSGSRLGSVKIGQDCTVRIDDGEKGYRSFTGRVSYVSPKAEFTPKIIQTKEERVTLVYAVEIEVQNDGTLKSGMPGEVIF
jgi:HlyD family secretion protein